MNILRLKAHLVADDALRQMRAAVNNHFKAFRRREVVCLCLPFVHLLAVLSFPTSQSQQAA